MLEGVHAYVYGAVPPDTDAERIPLELPGDAPCSTAMETVMAVDCVIDTELVLTQLLASVTVTEYVPADKPAAVALVPPVLHEYV